MNTSISMRAIGTAVGFSVIAFAAASAQEMGVTDSTIKIGIIQPLSGPASAYSQIAYTDQAYIKMINDNGGVCGRQIELILYDDGYSPPKTVEQARKLVESDEVFLIFNGLGTPTNSAIQKYMNAKKVPQLFVATGASKFGDHADFPWTMGWQPNYIAEGKIYARYILDQHPDGKIGILYQNDDYGKDYINGLRAGLGDKADDMIVMEQPYEVADPTVDSQIINLKSSGADIFINIATPKELAPQPELIDWARKNGAKVEVTRDPYAAVRGADCVVTDCWVSMGDLDETHRHNLLAPYQVNARLMAAANKDAVFMHCLPAHRGEEVTDDVMDGPQSVVFDEAENRLHAQKGVLAWCLEASR